MILLFYPLSFLQQSNKRVSPSEAQSKTMAPNRCLSALILFSALPAVIEGGFFKKKHRRQKAGSRYQEHDAVHVVVNKVG